MAVQAQCFSSALPVDFHSWVEPGGVVEGIQMMQRRNHQIGQFLSTTPVPDSVIRYGDQVPAGALTNATVLSDHPQSDLTCNVSSSCRKRRRDEPMMPTAAPIYQKPCFISQATEALVRAGTGSSPSGFQFFTGSFPVIESAAPSTSGVSSLSYLPFCSDFSPELLALLYQQNNEIDTLLRHQSEGLRLGMEEAQKRYCRVILSSLSRTAMKRIREKEGELENAIQRNAELEEKARQISAESLIWFNLAKNNEAVVSSLRTSLEQAMIQNITITSPTSLGRERFGENDCSPFPADDAQSCCFENAAVSPPASCNLRRRRVCKVCNDNDVCVLVLPCKHLCLCKSCDASVDTCPICHSHKNATLQIFMS